MLNYRLTLVFRQSQQRRGRTPTELTLFRKLARPRRRIKDIILAKPACTALTTQLVYRRIPDAPKHIGLKVPRRFCQPKTATKRLVYRVFRQFRAARYRQSAGEQLRPVIIVKPFHFPSELSHLSVVRAPPELPLEPVSRQGFHYI
jgi:hypothetical protein